jgi:hypothetical protein
MRTGDSFPGTVNIKAGIMIDAEWPNKNIPKAELFAPGRINWCNPVSGAPRTDGMATS